jgi:hypothetical protein
MQFDADAARRSTSVSDVLVQVAAALALKGARIVANRFPLDPTRPCAPTTANRVDEFNRRARNCSNFRARHRLAAGRELPYALLRPILSNSNWKLTQYSTNCHSNSNPMLVSMSLRSTRARLSRIQAYDVQRQRSSRFSIYHRIVSAGASGAVGWCSITTARPLRFRTASSWGCGPSERHQFRKFYSFYRQAPWLCARPETQGDG